MGLFLLSGQAKIPILLLTLPELVVALAVAAVVDVVLESEVVPNVEVP